MIGASTCAELLRIIIQSAYGNFTQQVKAWGISSDFAYSSGDLDCVWFINVQTLEAACQVLQDR
jgi:hypothetical protein